MRNVFFLLLLVLCAFVFGKNTQPEQVHIALTESADEMMITWNTVDSTSTTTVIYGTSPNALDKKATGKYSHYYLPFYISPAIHYVKLSNLTSDTQYYYKCGDAAGGWSKVFSFKTRTNKPTSQSQPLRIAVLSDGGVSDNSQMVLNSMMKSDHSKPFDFLVLAGDLSYANGIQSIWDTWGRMIEPLASHLPWMIAPGNHEAIELFIPYNYRFYMPTNGWSNLYYSFNYRNVHILILNSESINEFQWSDMYKFAKKDLESVNREETPWVIASWHHPWYCSNKKHQDSAWFMKYSYEELFFKQRVSLVLQGHVHAYERTHPVFKDKVTKGAPIYTTSGNGGNSEGLYRNWIEPKPEWSAYRDAFFGFSEINIVNSTHLYWEAVRGNDSFVSDSAWILNPYFL